MERLRLLKVIVCDRATHSAFAQERLHKRWRRWAADQLDIQVVFMTVSECPEDVRGHSASRTWNTLIAKVSQKDLLSAPVVLMASAGVCPGDSLLSSLQAITDRPEKGWWFSVKPPPYYFHNVLVKEGALVKNFEMAGVFSMDEERGMFFNHITGRHFLNAQDAPQILQNDNGLCLINPKRFSLKIPLPFEFSDIDYRWVEKGR